MKRNHYQKLISSTINDLWRNYKYNTNVLDSLNTRTELYYHFYSKLNLRTGINSFEVKERKASGTILSKMTDEEIKKTFYYLINEYAPNIEKLI